MVDLFQSIDIKEKGIEEIYDLLLQEQSIEDIKEFVDNTGTSLKRVYKVIQLLEKLGLVQVYNRPMIVNIKDPIPSWEAIISEKIKEIRAEADKRVEICEETFKSFIDTYELEPNDLTVPPVEFINIASVDYSPEFVKTEIIGSSKSLKIAKGDKIATPFNRNLFSLLQNSNIETKLKYQEIQKYCIEWRDVFPPISLKVLITEEYLNDILSFLERTMNSKLLGDLENSFNFSKLEVRITNNVLTNFILKDRKELLQYSTSPNNELIGLFSSRQHEICDIFTTKFDEEFRNARKLDEFYISELNKSLDSFTQFIISQL